VTLKRYQQKGSLRGTEPGGMHERGMEASEDSPFLGAVQDYLVVGKSNGGLSTNIG